MFLFEVFVVSLFFGFDFFWFAFLELWKKRTRTTRKARETKRKSNMKSNYKK
jgi:hypothetical protein